MSVTSVDKDYDSLTLTLVAEFEAPVEMVWRLWAEPDLLQRWWGPPGYPATFLEHDLSEGGKVAYYMTGPEGEKYRGWWRVESVQAPLSLRFTDGFADDEGNPVDDMPVITSKVTIAGHEGGSRMVIETSFVDRAQMDQIMEMGAAEGLTEAVSQMDAILAELGERPATV